MEKLHSNQETPPTLLHHGTPGRLRGHFITQFGLLTCVSSMTTSLEMALSFGSEYGEDIYLTMWQPKVGEVSEAEGKVGVFDQRMDIPPGLKEKILQEINVANAEESDKLHLIGKIKTSKFYLPNNRLLAIATLNPSQKKELTMYVGHHIDNSPDYMKRYVLEVAALVRGARHVLEAAGIRMFDPSLTLESLSELVIHTELEYRMAKFALHLQWARRQYYWESPSEKRSEEWLRHLSTLQEFHFKKPDYERRRVSLVEDITTYLSQIQQGH